MSAWLPRANTNPGEGELAFCLLCSWPYLQCLKPACHTGGTQEALLEGTNQCAHEVPPGLSPHCHAGCRCRSLTPPAPLYLPPMPFLTTFLPSVLPGQLRLHLSVSLMLPPTPCVPRTLRSDSLAPREALSPLVSGRHCPRCRGNSRAPVITVWAGRSTVSDL